MMVDRQVFWLTVVVAVLSIQCAYSAPSVCELSLASTNGVSWVACRSGKCFPSTVPGTAFIALLDNGEFPNVTDPFLDDTLKFVPDISETGSDFWSFTYVSTFSLASLSACISSIPGTNKHLIFELSQINYRATVSLNGQSVAPLGAPEVAGMYRRFLFDFGSPSVSTEYNLSVSIVPPDHPGNSSSACKGCGQGGNHQLVSICILGPLIIILFKLTQLSQLEGFRYTSVDF